MNFFANKCRGFGIFAKTGFIYLAFMILFAAGVMFSYLYASPSSSIMTAEGFVYLFFASIGHAATFLLVPYLVYLLAGAVGLRRTASVVMVALCSAFMILLVLNRQVYAIYRFHINGFIINMLTGEGAGEIFVLDTMMVLKESALLAVFVAVSVALYFLSGRIYVHLKKIGVWAVSLIIMSCVLFGHLYHAYAAFVRYAPVVRAAVVLPYFYPLTAKSLLKKLGVKQPEGNMFDSEDVAEGEISFPLEDLITETPDSLPDIYLVLLDSWNFRGFAPDVMPNAWSFAQNSTMFTNHLSSSNGTRCSVFGIFFGVPGYYWESFETGCVPPPLITRLQNLGYNIQAFPSANLHNPDFRTMVFRNVENLNEAQPGKDTLESDEILASRFVTDIDKNLTDSAPRFNFLFFDLPHAIALPPDRNTHFTPAWAYADYTRLDNSLDPTEFWNLYRNCLYEDDILLGKVLDAIYRRERETGRKSLVILSGDHGQEFNENKHNYWGHSGNYSAAQIKVPLVVRFPDGSLAGKTFSHRTTHYDFVPTIMGRYLGVKNSPDKYSLGYDLADCESDRSWHIAGSNINYAFVIQGDTILEKGGAGELYVYDASMNPLEDYRVNAVEMAAAFEKLNRFFKR